MAGLGRLLVGLVWVTILMTSCGGQGADSVTVPVTLDHNRMLVDAEIQRADGSWRAVRLWIDTGNPEFFLSQELAHDLGIEVPESTMNATGEAAPLEVAAPTGVRVGGMVLDFRDVPAKVMFQPRWLFSTMHNDANLPATVLQRYQVVFDYPALRLILARPGQLRPTGQRVEASIHPETGIVQIDARIDGDSLSFALDNGASYSFASADLVTRISHEHPQWPYREGALGCANIWGWWPQEASWPIVRVPDVRWGNVRLEGVGLVGLPNFFPNGLDVGGWYSHKSARPVDGFLGPNAFSAFRVTIDYGDSAVYFEPGAPSDPHDMDLVGLTLRPVPDGRYMVIGVAADHGAPGVVGVEPGDILLHVDDLAASGATMGAVVDALRGTPGETRLLVLERDGEQVRVEAHVRRHL